MLKPAAFPDTALRKVLSLDSAKDTALLGTRLAQALSTVNPGAFLLFGELGAGKTTLCRSLVGALPGGENAEVASPSFTICNIYCTEPAVHHFDLYRLHPGSSDEALEESLDTQGVVTIVEWPEHMHARDFPSEGIALRLSPGRTEEGRRAELAPLGPLGSEFLGIALSQYP